MGDISDPEEYERQHDEELLRTPDSPEEEDPEEDPMWAPTTEFDEEIPVIEVEADEDDDQTEGQEWEESQSPDSVLPLFSPERSPSPPLPPALEGHGEQAPEPTPAVDVSPAGPVTPPHVPLQGVPVFAHGWIVSRLTTDLAVAEARLAESRLQLAAERSARLRTQQVRMALRPQAFRRRVARIERRVLARIRALPTVGGGRVSRVDTERMVRIAMLRVRALTRARG